MVCRHIGHTPSMSIFAPLEKNFKSWIEYWTSPSSWDIFKMQLQISFSFVQSFRSCSSALPLLSPKKVRCKLLSSLSGPSLFYLWLIFVIIQSLSFPFVISTPLNHSVSGQDPDVNTCRSALSPSIIFLFLLSLWWNYLFFSLLSFILICNLSLSN